MPDLSPSDRNGIRVTSPVRCSDVIADTVNLVPLDRSIVGLLQLDSG
jgi:hypothetical protein